MDRSSESVNYIATFLVVIAWIVKYVVWTTPNNVLQASQYSNLVGNEFIGSFIFGVIFSFIVYKTKNNYTNKLHYWFNLSNCFALSLFPIAFVVLMFIGVLLGNGP